MTTCAALYNHTNLRGGNRIYPCCRFKKSIQTFDGDVKNILHTDEYENLRNRLEFGEKLEECSKCWHEESLGKKSLRQWFNEQYSTDEVKLKYFEVGFDNICDLTCDSCWEEWSSSWWVKKNPALPPKQGVTSTTELRNIPESIEKVVFLGGEPLMTNRHQRFLESFDTLKNLEVEYFTNGMHSLDQSSIALLSKCKHVKFTISIDGYGVLNQQVRSGSNWTTITEFVKKLPFDFTKVIHTTIHTNNWHGLLDLYNWCKINQYAWTTNVLTFPKELDIINLEQSNKKQLIDILNSIDVPNREYIQAHLQGEH
jgi:sulfatase maturation enzyme AslB (radical SAM superfamily)